MAEIVRKSEELLTIRLRMDMSSEGLQLTADSFRGNDRLGDPMRISLASMGYIGDEPEEAASRMYFPEGGAVPSRLEEIFRETAYQAENGEALWLQIGYGSEILAAYPWEEHFSTMINMAIMRIPNFARNTYRRPSPADPIIFCAGTPRAKDAPDWALALETILSELKTTQPIVLYLGRDDHRRKRNFNLPHLNIRIADLPSAKDAPRRETFISSRDKIANPWLRWIIDDQAQSSTEQVHAVHFLCTGYAQDRTGAIALPESPGFDNDTSWARFVGVPEFAAFADTLNCQITGFTALGSPLWREGLRLFANELSWKRPGPLFVDYGKTQTARVFNRLIDGEILATDATPKLSLSIHPKAVSSEDAIIPVTRSFRTSSTQADFSAELEFLQSLPQLPATQTLPNEVQRVMDRLSSAKPKSVLQSARDRGALRAMAFLTGLSNDTTALPNDGGLGSADGQEDRGFNFDNGDEL